MIRVGLVDLILGACLLAASAADARPASTGFFAEGGLGMVGFLPSTADDAAAGPALTLRIGHDLFSWLSIGGYAAASTHEATVPPPPQGQYFQLYRAGGDARLTLQLARFAPFVEGGVGLSVISSNVLEKVMITKPGSRTSITFHGGAGIEYQLENRHYATGVAADAFVAPQFASMAAIEARLYLRYTYGGG